MKRLDLLILLFLATIILQSDATASRQSCSSVQDNDNIYFLINCFYKISSEQSIIGTDKGLYLIKNNSEGKTFLCEKLSQNKLLKICRAEDGIYYIKTDLNYYAFQVDNKSEYDLVELPIFNNNYTGDLTETGISI